MEGDAFLGAKTTAGAKRVAASRHSRLYGNAFSIDDVGIDVVDSVPDKDRQPASCCPCWSLVTCSGCSGAGQAPPEFRDTLSVDAEAMTLLVSSGFTFHECRPALRAAGLILHGTPETDSITIGGAIAVGAHGGGRWQKPISGYVQEMWIRDGKGTGRHITRSDPLFPAAAVSLGLLGVIVKVKLQCFRAQKNRKVVASVVGAYGGKGIATATPETHSFQFAPYMQRMVRFDETETDQCAPNCCACCFTTTRALTALPCVTGCVECALPCCPCMACILSQSLVCPGTCTFSKFDTFLPTPANYAYTVEYAVDVAAAASVFEQLQACVQENATKGRYVTYRFWCRYIGGVDQSWALAQSAGGDKVAFEFTMSQRQRGVEEFLDAILTVLQSFEARPHLGKTIRLKDVPYAAKVIGKAAGGAPFLAFEHARQQLDPAGLYLNGTLKSFIAAATKEAKAARS